jgi:AcrR family transcriptional regulator
MSQSTRTPSARYEELLDGAYLYAGEHGLAELSLRPLAAAIGSSPRVLLFLFGSKEGLVRALLAKARGDELALLERVRQENGRSDLAAVIRTLWQWFLVPRHRPLLTLWLEAYGRSLIEPHGPWSDFARQTVDDWLAVLAGAQDPERRRTEAGAAERTLALSVLRGGLLDLLATNDTARITAAVEWHLRHLN